MALQWDATLELGLEEIDNQHRSIFAQFQKLSEAVQQGEPAKAIAEMSAFLCEYANMHFATEEKIMAEFDYPEIEIQMQAHEQFRKDADQLKIRIGESGVSREIAIETTGKLFRWIIQHIKNHDKKMVVYIKERMALNKQS